MSFLYLMVDHHLVVAKVWVLYLYQSPIIGEQKVEVEPCDHGTAARVYCERHGRGTLGPAERLLQHFGR